MIDSDPANLRAIRAYEKAGFIRRGNVEQSPWRPATIMSAAEYWPIAQEVLWWHPAGKQKMRRVIISRMFLITALLILGGVSVSAAPTYEVTGVSADDVLNIRQAPRPSARKVGEYGPRDKGIRIYRRDGNWALTGRSNPDEPDGWVHTRYLKATSATARLELPMSCLGTEPFWSLTVNSVQRASYSDPETTDRRYRVSEFRRTGRDAAMRLDANGHVSIVAENCSDGMSDNQYPYSVRVLLPNGRKLNGCCG